MASVVVAALLRTAWGWPFGAPTGHILSLGILSKRIRAERISTERICTKRILVTKYPILNVSYPERILLETYPLS